MYDSEQTKGSIYAYNLEYIDQAYCDADRPHCFHANGAVFAEGFALGVAYGLDLSALLGNLEQCSASASFSQIGKPMTQSPGDDVNFQLSLGTKDLRYSTELAGQLGSRTA